MSDLLERRGIKHLRVHGKGGKIRFLPLHPVAAERIYAYLELDSARDTSSGPLFRSVRGKTTGAGVTANGLYTVVAYWARVAGIEVDGLGVQHLEVGDDFRFGCDRVGDFDFLQQAGQMQGFTVEAAQTVELDGVRISSTKVRDALASADFSLAERLLGRPFQIAGRVLHGQKLARQLGTPTANVQLKRRRVPLTGVYLVSVDIDGQSWSGVANIGVRPTVAGDGKAHLEVHLLDFAGDLYDRRLTVVFHQKLREEQRFASLEALKTAINADVAAARALAAPSAHR